MVGPSKSNLFQKTSMLSLVGQIIFSFLPINGLSILFGVIWCFSGVGMSMDTHGHG